MPGSKAESADGSGTVVQTSESYLVAIFLTLVGGFLDAYTYVCRDGVFANAQTGNFARLAVSLANADLHAALRYLVSIGAFILGITVAMQIRTHVKSPLHWRQVSVLLEMCLLFVVALIPIAPRTNITANFLISFICAVQVESFRKFRGSVFASTMCTGNLRSATENLNHYFTGQDRAALGKSVRYFSIDVTFVVGAAAGALCTKHFGSYAVFVCCGLLAFVFAAMFFPGVIWGKRL